MYKVFINEHCLFLSQKRDNYGIEAADIQLDNPTKKDILSLTQNLLEEKGQKSVQLLYDRDHFFEDFSSCFKYIEAAGGLVRNEEDELLMIYRFEKWDLPKGKLEKGEEPSSAAVREVEEECGIEELTIKSELPSTFHIYEQAGRIFLKITYWYEMTVKGKPNLIPQSEEGIEAVKWMSEIELTEARKNTYSSLMDLLN